MDTLGKDIFKKMRKNDDELEKNFEQLKENMIYGQQLMHTGSWTYDLQKDEVFLSEELYHIMGCTPQEFENKLESFYSYVHADDLEILKEATEGLLKGKEYDIEYRVVTTSGIERHVHEKTKVLYDEKKNLIKMIGVIQDITQHKLIENDLKAFGENLNQVQKVAGVGSWKYDMVENKIHWSEEMYRIHDIESLDLNKDYENILKSISQEDQIKVQKAVKDCQIGKSFQIEYRIPQHNGLEKYVVSKGEPLFNKEEQVVGILGTLQDITERKLLEEELEKSYKNLAKAQHLAQIGSWEMDITHDKLYWSEETYRIYGVTPEQFDGTFMDFIKFVQPEDIAIIQNTLQNPPKEHLFELDFRIIRADGAIRSLHHLIEPLFDKEEQLIFAYGTIQDITEKKELEASLEQTREAIQKMQKQFQVLVQDSDDVFEIITPDGIIQYISPAVEKIMGYKPKERIGKNRLEYLEVKEKFKLAKMLALVLQEPKETVRGDIKTKTKEGKDIYLELNIRNQLSEPALQGIVINWRDITRRIEMERNIQYNATHDELTKLPNRVYFKKEIKHRCEEANEKRASFALMMLDIDGFKYINDVLGYALADQLIIQVTQRLRNFLGDDRFMCRYSGDQFAVIISEVDMPIAYERIAKDMISLFSRPFEIDTYELRATMSMGISIYPSDEKDADGLIKHANIALLRAKSEGKNRYIFYSQGMNIQNYKQFMLRNDLPKAIEKGQLKIYYQPEVNIQTSEIIAAEALIRWDHPTWGLVPPDEFISIAEETGFIIDLGKWILREVCCTYKKWLSTGLPAIKIAINYSGVQFYEKNFVKNLKDIIDEFKLDPCFIVVEIVESVLINNFEQVVADIKKLQAYGMQIALDDFGTGFSSLGYLNKFTVDILKVDRSFITNIPLDETSTVITRTVINLAHELKMKVVAEGIETWDQLSYLRKLNCYLGQGFLYSKPVPREEFEKLLAAKKCRPIRVNDAKDIQTEERRKYFRIQFPQLLEADMTILEIRGKKANVGNTKALIKNIGIGGICFVSNIRLPINKDIVLEFKTQLLGNALKLYGCPIWTEEVRGNLYEYGIEFKCDENEQMILTGILNQFQIKLRNNLGFNEGRFISDAPPHYFNCIEG